MSAERQSRGLPGTGSMGAAEWGLLVVLSVLWGGSFFFSKIALRELPPLTVVLGRVAVAAAALNVMVVISRSRMPRSLTAWGPFFVMGALNNLIPFSLIFWGQTQISSGLASILNATGPLFTVLLVQTLARDDRLTSSRLAGVVVGFVGAAVVIGPEALSGVGGHLLGEIAILGAALSYGFAKLFGRRLREIPPLLAACGQISATTLMALPIAFVVDRPWLLPRVSGITIVAVVALALLSTALGYTIYFRLLATAGPTNLSLVTYLIPVTALLLGTLILGERLAFHSFVGMAIIFAGLAFVDGRPLAKLRARRGCNLHEHRAAGKSFLLPWRWERGRG